MNRSFPSPSVVVGIDGSKSSIRAAIWAVDEAVQRDIPLRLVYVIDARTDEGVGDGAHAREYAAAYHAAHEAWRAVESTGEPVKIEMEVLRGEPVAELVEASRHAALICLGSKGRHRHHGRRRGATATSAAEAALCSAVIVRSRARFDDGRIVALLDDSSAAPAVLQIATEEARLRNVPMVVMTSRSAPDTTNPVRPMPKHICNALAQHANIDQLVVVDKSSPDLIAELIGPKGRRKLRKTCCSVRIVR